MGGSRSASGAGRADNEFFAFLTSIGAGGVRGDQLPMSDPVEDAIRAAPVEVLATGDVPAPIEIADDAALAASLSRAGIGTDPVTNAAATRLTAAAAPYRRPDGSYRFDNRLRYWLLRRAR